MPFIRTVVSLLPGEELVALYEINMDEDLFLRDHTLGRKVSMTDSALRGLPVMPLTMSMEMLAEAAAVLSPGQRLLGMRDIRAHRWIALEGERLTLELVARRDPAASGQEVYVQIREANATGESPSPARPIIEGTMIFGEAYPEPPVPGEFTLRGERASKWTPEQLYEDVMFHGPAFRGVVSMDRWGEDGAEATLEVLSTSGLFRSNPAPSFVTDPVLLDQPGQVVGFWAAEHLETGYVVLPFRLKAIHFYGPNPSVPERVRCRARIHLIGERQTRSHLEIVRPHGHVWAQFVGWEDRRFDLPRPFFRSLLSPRDTVLSEPWPTPVAPLPRPDAFQACRLSLQALPEGLFTAHGGIWQRVLAHLVLSRRERDAWRSLRAAEPRRTEWLLGRVVAKDAVRLYLKQRYGTVLCPADIEILPDEHGRPMAHGAWSRDVSRVPILSLSHSDGVAVAVVGDRDVAAGVGVDIEHVGRMREGAEGVAFTPDEQALLASLAAFSEDSWPLRLWCAKEAVAKALGQGMVPGPHALVVKELHPGTGTVEVSLVGEMARRFPAINGRSVVAYTAREGDLIVATSVTHEEDA